MLRTCILATAASAVLVAASPVSAQRGLDVQLHGRVIDNGTLAPIEGARLLVIDAGGSRIATQVTDAFGAFSFRVSRKIGIKLRADRIGYQQNTTPFLYFDDHQFFNLEIRLDPDAVLLAPLEVMARSGRASPVLEDFRHRVRSGFGYYITRDEIERVQPRLVTDLLVRVPGVELVSSGTGLRRRVQMSRGARAAAPCPTQIFLDGMLLNRWGNASADITIDDVVSPPSVEGIEIYRGPAGLPAQFLNRNAACGVIAIWTRRGDTR